VRSHIRLLLPLVTVLAFAVVFSTPRRARMKTVPAGHASLRSLPAAHGHAPVGRCGDDSARHGHHAAEGQSFDSDARLASPDGMFASAFGEEVEMAHGAHEFVFEGSHESDAWANVLPPLMPAQTFDVTVGPGGTLTFEPDELTINVGDTVRWTWASPNHTVTSGPGCTVDSQYCSPNNTSCSAAPTSSTGFVYTHTFNTPGSFTYFCKIHCASYAMRGTIIVQGAASTFSISGKVTTGDGAALSGATMTLSGAQSATVTTDASGNYSFPNLAAGNYTVTPSHANYTFTPASRAYTSLAANQTAQDFTAAPKLYSISGAVKEGTAGLAGVTMTLTSPTPAGFTPRTATTDASGLYTFSNVPAARNYTLTPTKTGYSFKNTSNTTQSSRTYTNLSGNQTAQDFAATLNTYAIGGTVRLGTSGLAGVTMTLTSPSPAGFTPRTATTTSTGAYSFTSVPGGRNYTLTPTKTNYTFKNTSNTTQAFRSYTNLSASQTAQDFTATLKLYTISGTVRVGSTGLGGVTMTLTSPSPAGFTPRVVTTTSTGAYTFTNVPAGRNYTLTPTKTNYTFKNTSNTSQAVRTYTNLSANQTAQDFAATLKLYSISGTVRLGTAGLASVTMTLTSPSPAGFTPRTVTTNSTGAYTLANVPAGRNYTLTPAKTNYTFKNTSNTAQAVRTYTNLSANQTAQDFAATLKLYNISGRVTLADATTGVNAVTLTLTSPSPAGFTPRTVMTNSTGNYSFAGVSAARSYTLTPTKAGFTFSPTSRGYPTLSANQSGAATSFTGAATAAAASTVEFERASYSAGEGDGSIEVTVKREGDLSAPASVDYAADDGTALDRSDYSTALGTLRFAPGETTKSFTVFLTDDAFVEGDETVRLTLVGAEGGAGTGVRGGAAELTITDNDDAPSAANPIDDPAFFARQLYVDFLAREPRPEELAAVVNRLNQCAAGDATCDRASVVDALLSSEEFRQKGLFVYRLYTMTLARAPLYRELVGGVRQLKWAAGDDAAAAQEAFIDGWARRSAEFKTKYGSPAEGDFMDELARAAGIPAAARDAALLDLERGSKSRAQVLRELIEGEGALADAAGTPSFDLLHFGLLRRDALSTITLREFVSPDPQARRKLIEALITSAEYRSRFGQP
jgi:plastocyanin